MGVTSPKVWHHSDIVSVKVKRGPPKKKKKCHSKLADNCLVKQEVGSQDIY